MTFNRYQIPCYSCDGTGFYKGAPDKNDYSPLVNCRWCYRGVITIKLRHEDEGKLLAELLKSVSQVPMQVAVQTCRHGQPLSSCSQCYNAGF